VSTIGVPVDIWFHRAAHGGQLDATHRVSRRKEPGSKILPLEERSGTHLDELRRRNGERAHIYANGKLQWSATAYAILLERLATARRNRAAEPFIRQMGANARRGNKTYRGGTS
jgi:hypothetical protein